MGNTSSGMQRANEELENRREEARKQGLAELKIPHSPGNIASRR